MVNGRSKSHDGRASNGGRTEGEREVEVWTITSPEEFARSTDRAVRVPACPPSSASCLMPTFLPEIDSRAARNALWWWRNGGMDGSAGDRQRGGGPTGNSLNRVTVFRRQRLEITELAPGVNLDDELTPVYNFLP